MSAKSLLIFWYRYYVNLRTVYFRNIGPGQKFQQDAKAVFFLSQIPFLYEEQHTAIMSVYSKFGKFLSTIPKITQLLQKNCNICEIMR